MVTSCLLSISLITSVSIRRFPALGDDMLSVYELILTTVDETLHERSRRHTSPSFRSTRKERRRRLRFFQEKILSNTGKQPVYFSTQRKFPFSREIGEKIHAKNVSHDFLFKTRKTTAITSCPHCSQTE
uniref:Uncharacterized protein n=1 Tax=Cacopsylla melanoneura TaxID=428564 RepID=A0A8D8YEF6_9HEMI